MELTFLGSGDAFGSGGRLNTCFLLRASSCSALIDCGASSLIALKRASVDPNTLDVILVTHFHADHFGGVPFLVLDAQFFARRRRALQIVGPVGLASWYARVLETAFPGASRTPPKFPLELIELAPGCTRQLGPLQVTSFQAHHDPSGSGPFLAYRVELEGRVVAYTGDGEWADALLEVARDADVFIAEAYFLDKHVPLHLSLGTLLQKLPLITARRVMRPT
jgi:ribonuclease BN (tRNA processing enzyme)